MFRLQKSPSWPPAIDLSTMRETLAYMESDLKRVPGLELAAKALETARAEIDAVEKQRNQRTVALNSSRFVPFASRFIARR
jgi:hypothetical protein